MKKFLLILVVVLIAIQFFQTDKTNPKVDKSLEIKTDEYIMQIFKKSCYDCHSNETKYPWYSHISPISWTISKHVNEGRKALNFSVWESYTQNQKNERLKNIYRTVYASMPIATYLWVHKKAVLNKDERTAIRDWTGVKFK